MCEWVVNPGRAPLLDFLHNIFVQVDQGMCCGVLFLDLQKAFDTIDHKVLLAKLRAYGVRTSAMSWLDSYLEGCQQVTKVGQKISGPLPVPCGVPQGSILGPLLFSLYVNDLPSDMPADVKVNLYADDTALTVCSNNSEELQVKLNMALESVARWFVKN